VNLRVTSFDLYHDPLEIELKWSKMDWERGGRHRLVGGGNRVRVVGGIVTDGRRMEAVRSGGASR
jgi:hypothetical protein